MVRLEVSNPLPRPGLRADHHPHHQSPPAAGARPGGPRCAGRRHRADHLAAAVFGQAAGKFQMITIIISGPSGVGKTRIARGVIEKLRRWGFVSFEVYTTNLPVTIPVGATREE